MWKFDPTELTAWKIITPPFFFEKNAASRNDAVDLVRKIRTLKKKMEEKAKKNSVGRKFSSVSQSNYTRGI